MRRAGQLPDLAKGSRKSGRSQILALLLCCSKSSIGRRNELTRTLTMVRRRFVAQEVSVLGVWALLAAAKRHSSFIRTQVKIRGTAAPATSRGRM